MQPYVVVGFLWGLSVENDDYIMSSTTGGYSYGMQGHVDLPWFSIGPVVGVDLYLFSCIALQLEYGYRWGIDARFDGHYTDGRSNRTGFRHARVNRHAVSVGLKVTSPFSFSRRDANSLRDVGLPSLFDILVGN